MLRVKQVAERLNLSLSKVYQLIDGCRLPHHRFGGAIRISEEQMAAFLEETEHRTSERSTEERRPKARGTLRHLKVR